jgi:hypothetical protein
VRLVHWFFAAAIASLLFAFGTIRVTVVEISLSDLSLRRSTYIGFLWFDQPLVRLSSKVESTRLSRLLLKIGVSKTASQPTYLLVNLDRRDSAIVNGDGNLLRRILYSGNSESALVDWTEKNPDISMAVWASILSDLQKNDLDSAMSELLSMLRNDRTK